MDRPITVTLDEGGALMGPTILTVAPSEVGTDLFILVIETLPDEGADYSSVEPEDLVRMVVTREALGNLVRTLGAEGIV